MLLIIKKSATSVQLLKAGAGKLSLPLPPSNAVSDLVKISKNYFWVMPCRQKYLGSILSLRILLTMV